jgi:hypothetical protein
LSQSRATCSTTGRLHDHHSGQMEHPPSLNLASLTSGREDVPSSIELGGAPVISKLRSRFHRGPWH